MYCIQRTETLKRHLLSEGEEGLRELENVAVMFEEKTYVAASSQVLPEFVEFKSPLCYIPILHMSMFIFQLHWYVLWILDSVVIKVVCEISFFQSDYLRKISLKMLTMETKSQNLMGNHLQSNSAGNSNGSPDPGKNNY